MGKEEDNKNRNELKEVIEKTILDKELKKKLLDFAEELENGRLEQLLNSIKSKIKNEC